MIISNTSPLIHLAKVGKLELLRKLFKTVQIPLSVYNEVIKHPKNTETIIIKKKVNEGWLKIKKSTPKEPLKKFSNIAKTELEVIALAIKEGKTAIIDDKNAVQIANIFNVNVHGTLFIILEAVKKKLLKKKEAINIVNQMMENEFYLSNDVYALFLDLLELRSTIKEDILWGLHSKVKRKK